MANFITNKGYIENQADNIILVLKRCFLFKSIVCSMEAK